MIMPANAFPRSLPSAAMPNPIVSPTPQPTCSFGSGVLSPGNSQSICHAVMDAFPIVPGTPGLAGDCGKLRVAPDPEFCMRLLSINRADLGSHLHSELKAALGITMDIP